MSNKLIDKLNIVEKKGPRKAMVLAAGLGRRLRPITTNVPKPLVKLAGRTLLDYTLDHLVAAGVECAVVNIHYLADKIKHHLMSRSDIEIIISSEEDNSKTFLFIFIPSSLKNST